MSTHDYEIQNDALGEQGDLDCIERAAQILAKVPDQPSDPHEVVPPFTRETVLTTAEQLINGDRAKDYGDASENFQRIANLWTPILGVQVTATDVALCLTQLKVARLITSPAHKDSWIDAAGYIALGGEIANKEQS
ncbi:DUF6378 domain-containing protein [Glutamicibacter sp. ZJUTW]|uniref:DUF6378 domain-containing protein n=1 Tax=Glutamicibacter sp. ZJUTW TaxID=1155384 RepID=UPI001AEFDD50|nr:DUF6378 domain-containing protein [Glutamicibacter sp. ZJUTW]